MAAATELDTHPRLKVAQGIQPLSEKVCFANFIPARNAIRDTCWLALNTVKYRICNVSVLFGFPYGN